MRSRSGSNAGPSFSIIIEWDNARLSEIGRTEQMLKALQKQVMALQPQPARPPQIVILYDRGEVDPAIIHHVVEQAIDAGAWNVDFRVVETDGLGYYQQKNFGLTLTDREIVIYLDSDVIPEPGWLDGLIDAIEQPEVDVVCGNTYVTTSNLFTKAFALFWFFPLRSQVAELRRAESFFANNVAFKRAVIERHHFPDLQSFRGQCYVLATILERNGHAIYRQERARVSHPPPNGLRHFYRRALCEGHDEVFLHKALKSGRLANSPVGSALRLVQGLQSSISRTIRHRRGVGLSVFGAFAAVGLATTYYLLKFVGEILTFIDPGFVRRYASI